MLQGSTPQIGPPQIQPGEIRQRQIVFSGIPHHIDQVRTGIPDLRLPTQMLQHPVDRRRRVLSRPAPDPLCILYGHTQIVPRQVTQQGADLFRKILVLQHLPHFSAEPLDNAGVSRIAEQLPAIAGPEEAVPALMREAHIAAQFVLADEAAGDGDLPRFLPQPDVPAVLYRFPCRLREILMEDPGNLSGVIGLVCLGDLAAHVGLQQFAFGIDPIGSHSKVFRTVNAVRRRQLLFGTPHFAGNAEQHGQAQHLQHPCRSIGELLRYPGALQRHDLRVDRAFRQQIGPVARCDDDRQIRAQLRQGAQFLADADSLRQLIHGIQQQVPTVGMIVEKADQRGLIRFACAAVPLADVPGDGLPSPGELPHGDKQRDRRRDRIQQRLIQVLQLERLARAAPLCRDAQAHAARLFQNICRKIGHDGAIGQLQATHEVFLRDLREGHASADARDLNS